METPRDRAFPRLAVAAVEAEAGVMFPARFRKRPVIVEAMQFDGSDESQRAIVNWSKGIVEGCVGNEYLRVRTREGSMRADKGDWIICGVAGEFYPCKPDIFVQTYEAA